MDAHIELAGDDCSCLASKVSIGSPLHKVFEPPQLTLLSSPGPGLPFGGDVVIECSVQSAEELLEIAKSHCPGAIFAIKEALRLASHSR